MQPYYRIYLYSVAGAAFPDYEVECQAGTADRFLSASEAHQLVVGAMAYEGMAYAALAVVVASTGFYRGTQFHDFNIACPLVN